MVKTLPQQVTLQDSHFLHLLSLLGPEGFTRSADQINAFHQNTTGFKPRQILGIARPASTEQVRQLIDYAQENHLPLYPIGTGYNWGMGSKLPVKGPAILVQTTRMNQIRLVNEEFHYAIIEPGVTQTQLHDYLRAKGLKLRVNVTGSSIHSCIIGNVLERGTGFQNHRSEDLRGMEIVLGNGQILRTGFWHQQHAKRESLHYKYGVGPHLDGLFCQSNYGIVTAIVFDLIPEPEASTMLWCRVTETNLPTLADALKDCFRHRWLHEIVHIGNDKRMKIAIHGHAPEPTWTAVCNLRGDADMVALLQNKILAKLAPIAEEMRFHSAADADYADQSLETRQLMDLHNGKPANVFIRAMYRSEDDTLENGEFDIDFGHIGMLCCLPIGPMNGDSLREAAHILRTVCPQYGLEAAATFNPLNDLCFESVINLYFDLTDPGSTQNAHECNTALHKAFWQAGFHFYRFDIEHMGQYIDPSDTFWQTTRNLKEVLDPAGIISPGRYNLI